MCIMCFVLRSQNITIGNLLQGQRRPKCVTFLWSVCLDCRKSSYYAMTVRDGVLLRDIITHMVSNDNILILPSLEFLLLIALIDRRGVCCDGLGETTLPTEGFITLVMPSSTL